VWIFNWLIKDLKMKISVDDQELFRLSSTQKKVIQNDIQSEIFDEDMKRRLHHVLMHKYEQCFERLKKEWEPKLKSYGVEMFPSNEDAFAEMVFARPEYKNRSQRESENT
jgi:hypothetical protein